MNTPAKMPWTTAHELRHARLEADLEQKDLAALLDPPVVEKTISRWETGHGQPNITQWRQIAKACRAPWLLYGGDELGGKRAYRNYRPIRTLTHPSGLLAVSNVHQSAVTRSPGMVHSTEPPALNHHPQKSDPATTPKDYEWARNTHRRAAS